MKDNETLVRELAERGITARDLEDTIHALMQDKNAATLESVDELEAERIAQQLALEVDALTEAGLAEQVAWMDRYYANRENLNWALSGYLTLPLAA